MDSIEAARRGRTGRPLAALAPFLLLVTVLVGCGDEGRRPVPPRAGDEPGPVVGVADPVLSHGAADAPADVAPEPASPPEVHPSGLAFHRWKRLDLVTDSTMLLSGTVTLRRREGDYRPPEGGKPRRALLLESQTRASALLVLNVELESTSELDPVDGSTREYVEVTPGKKAKLLRVEPRQLLLVRYLPPDGGAGAPLRKWEIQEDKRWKRKGGESPPPLYDYYALIARLADLPLERRGDRATVWMASSSGPIELEIGVEERRSQERTLVDLASETEHTVRLDELRLGLRPLEGDGDKVRGFLQMEGETEVWVEAESRTVLEIRGKVPRIGMISVSLHGLR